MLISHILYGQATIVHGGIEFAARDAGSRGEEISLVISAGSSLLINVNFKGEGQFVGGSIGIDIPAGTTEAQLLTALNASDDFQLIANARQKSGNGSGIVAPLTPTHFVASGGLVQHLQTKLEIINWSDRDFVTTGAPVGYLFLARAKCVRPDPDEELWEGVVQIGAAFTHKSDYIIQNSILDLVRKNLHAAIRIFKHSELTGFGPFEYQYGNELKDEATGKTYDHAQLRVMGTIGVKWVETATRKTIPLNQILIGLFREPLDDSLGGPGREIKDTDIVVEEE